uniref:PPIase cyclophilin-type domain-containing protein n=1 Tax=Gossypium raimondii TaxID=29730 RepID=A0A0D2REV8_GOSRA|nr:hypothetical protein B456_005G140100 [Gossypium raimondii]
MKVWELTNASLDQAPRRLKRESKTRRKEDMKILWWVSLVFVITNVGALAEEPQLSSPRVVFQTNHGDIEFGFYPSVAPKTVDHIFKLVRLGCYNTNHFFRVDRGFVAQVADVASGRSAPMNEKQRREAEKTIVGEFSDVKHVRGILSMGRYSDPDSAQSSFSILLGDAPHLDGQPVERITILSSYYYDTELESCKQERGILKQRLAASAVEIERQRMKCFP